MKTRSFLSTVAGTPKAPGDGKPASKPTEAECRAVHRLVFAGEATPEESRTAVRYLLRQASKSLDRRA